MLDKSIKEFNRNDLDIINKLAFEKVSESELIEAA
jgi:hypothetical protein